LKRLISTVCSSNVLGHQVGRNAGTPLALRDNPFHVAAADSKVGTWAEFLRPTAAQALAYYDHPFFGRWPAMTGNRFGAGTLTYEGSALSDGLQ
jgi:beta-galactosidase